MMDDQKSIYPPDFVFPETFEDVSAHLKQLTFPGGFTCFTPPDPAEAVLMVMEQIFGKEQSDYLHRSEMRFAQVRTLSSIIQDKGITRIDYLKIDVEGDELSVLEGITESDWQMISQVAIEVHSEPLREQVCAHLAQHGFEVYIDRGLSSPVGVSNVYARRLTV